jgi:hypothetical protein
MADDLSFDITAHDDSSRVFDKVARKAQETALRIEAANLKVERATKKATEAETKYEKGSIQAREAAQKLGVAQLNLSKVMEASAAKVDVTRDKVDKLEISEEKLSTTSKKVDTDHNRLSNTMKKLGSSLASAGLGALKGVGAVASLASVAVTAGIAVGKFAVATAHLAVATGPALAGLLPLAAGALLIKKTLTAAGPAMLKAITPLTEAWKKQTVEVGKLASVGLRPLAKEFVKANFPQIGKAMNSIATTANAAVKSFVKWADSAPGVKAIGQVVAGTAHMFERLAPAAVQVGKAIVSLAGRVSGVTFNAFSDGAGNALRKFSRFLDRISATDVHDAFDKIGSLARSAGRGFEALGDGMAWAQANMKVIDEIRTAVAGLAIVIGVATGGWMIALGGAITLIVMNWGKLTAAFQAAGQWITAIGQKFPSLTGPMDAAKGAAQDIAAAFSDFVKQVGPHVQPFLDKMGDAFIRLQPTISGVISLVGGAIAVFLRFAGPAVGAWLDATATLIDAFSRVAEFVTFAVAGILGALGDMFQPIASLAKKLHLPFANAFQGMVDDAHHAAKRMTDGLAQTKVDLAVREVQRLQTKVNSLKGKKVKTEADKAAIASSMARIAQLQRQINNMHGANLTIGINTVRTTSGSTAPGARSSGGGSAYPGHRAAGGPVTAGRPYIVGEHNPELFIPSQNGTIMPRLTMARTGGGGVVNNYYSFPNYLGSEDTLVRALTKLNNGGRLQAIKR